MSSIGEGEESVVGSVKGQAAAHRRRAKLDADEEAVLSKIKASRPHHYDNEQGGPVRKGRTARKGNMKMTRSTP